MFGGVLGLKNIPLFKVRTIHNLKDMINSSVEIYGDKAAFLVKRKNIEGYVPVSYKQFKKDIDALGTALSSLGLKGKRIALIGENRYEWAVTYLSVVNGLGVIVPLDKELPSNEIESLLVRSKADAIVFSSTNVEQIKAFSNDLKSVKYYINMDLNQGTENILSFNSLIEKGNQLLEQGDRTFINAEIDEEVMNMLLFTSGTTETSKAVMLSHRNIAKNLMAMCSMTYIDDKDIFLSVLPMHHTYECTCGFLCPMYRGSTVAFCEGLRHIPKNLQESKATMLLGVPLIFEAMYKRIWDQAAKNGIDGKLRFAIKLSNFLKIFGIDITKKLFAKVHENFGNPRLYISGAAGIEPSVAKGFRDLGILFLQGYGLTECAPIAALNRNIDYKDDAAGLPLPGLEVIIDSPDEEGIGEILVKGPNVMLGYYENEEATKKAFQDGWYRTGDLGFIDRDKFVHITGRKKNVIVTKNGKNIFPEEIESLLNKSKYIKESMVYGQADEESGETLVAAVIVPDMDVISEEYKDKQLTEEEIRNIIQQEIKAVNKSLTLYKYIRNFQIRENEFIKTTTKKIKRYLEKNPGK